MEAGFEGKMAGSKRVQVKGRVALKSPLARFTPPGKAEQDCSSAPTDFSFPETGGGMEEKRGHRGRFQVAAGKTGRTGGCDERKCG